MNNFLIHAHSGWRWIVLILLLVAIAKAFMGWRKLSPYSNGDKKIFLFAMISTHIQLLGGLILYFTSDKVNFTEGWMKVPMLRFFGMEHLLMMIIATALITIGFRKHKTAEEDKGKFKKIFIFYLIALVVILAAIPWPFRTELLGSWF